MKITQSSRLTALLLIAATLALSACEADNSQDDGFITVDDMVAISQAVEN